MSTSSINPPPHQPVLLNYHTSSPGPRLRRIARRLWWAILVFAVAMLVFALFLFNLSLEWKEWIGYGILGTPAAPFEMGSRDVSLVFHLFDRGRRDYTLHACVYLGIFLLLQWAFLIPRGSWRMKLSIEGTSMFRSAAAAGFIAMLISTGFLAVMLDWPFAGKQTRWGYLTISGGSQSFGAFWLIMFCLWIAWAFILYLYGRRLDRYTWTTRIVRGLLAGSILETLIASLAHAWMVRRNEDCYCARGSWTGLVFGATALFWLFGPGLFLLLLREKNRLARLEAPALDTPLDTPTTDCPPPTVH